MGRDVLFMERGCQHCGLVKTALNWETVVDDGFKTTSGNEFFVYYSQSPAATKLLLAKFKIGGISSLPIVKKDNDELVTKVSDILEYLDEEGCLDDA